MVNYDKYKKYKYKYKDLKKHIDKEKEIYRQKDIDALIKEFENNLIKLQRTDFSPLSPEEIKVLKNKIGKIIIPIIVTKLLNSAMEDMKDDSVVNETLKFMKLYHQWTYWSDEEWISKLLDLLALRLVQAISKNFMDYDKIKRIADKIQEIYEIGYYLFMES